MGVYVVAGELKMDIKEKLIELLDGMFNGECCVDKIEAADFLIANGVTVQEWISVKKHLPQENEPEDTVCELAQVLLVNGDVSTGWCNRRTKLWWHFSYGASDFIDYDYDHTPVIAWQPLAQPPKGE